MTFYQLFRIILDHDFFVFIDIKTGDIKPYLLLTASTESVGNG